MRQRWEDWVNFILGIWLFFSPWILGYALIQSAAWNAYVIGVAFVVFTIWALSIPKPWEEWINAILGLWLLFSPWILGFSAQLVATWNALICGVIVLVLSLEATRPTRQPHVTA
jgi:hypothetical protein